MEEKRALARILEHEVLSYDLEEYLEWKQDLRVWIQEKAQLEEVLKEKKASRDKVLAEMTYLNRMLTIINQLCDW